MGISCKNTQSDLITQELGLYSTVGLLLASFVVLVNQRNLQSMWARLEDKGHIPSGGGGCCRRRAECEFAVGKFCVPWIGHFSEAEIKGRGSPFLGKVQELPASSQKLQF